ncbi:NAD-dependent epimerase/dehydratase family protein [Flavisericum labens]|uniref:NAD-dependent epimerase/dehydratase family protein n=1 Tax=Flavisericum labens TaxID=3377112 RepID=UPI00387AB7B0
MKVFVTGATGYVGHELALRLAGENFKVVALVRDLNSEKIPKHKNIAMVKGDICDFNSVEKAVKGCNYVFHTAAFTNLKCKSVDNFYCTNVLGTENVLKASQMHKVKKVIYTSTLSVFGPSYKEVPITETQPRIASFANDYELTKSMAEDVVKKYVKGGLSCVVLNVSKVYGPGLSTFSTGVNKLITMFMQKDFLVVPNKLESISNYVFIDDVVNAHLLAMKSQRYYGKFIIGGENISYRNLFLLIKKLTHSNIKILKIHYGSVKAFFSIANLLYALIRAVPSITPKVLDFLFVNRVSTSDKAMAELKYQATPLDVGLQRTIKHLKSSSS